MKQHQPLVLGCVLSLLLGGCDDLTTGEMVPTAMQGPENPAPICTGRQCQVNLQCPAEKGPTRLTGTVTIPAGTLPLYNAKVYIPIADVPPAPAGGPSCSRCDVVVPPDAVASATTDINGRFTLTNVPSGTDIPLIIRVGKWRRVVTIPSISECAETRLTEETTRLPRNQSEGTIPRIALSTGNADALECLLRKNKLGLDDSEFTNETGAGRVNLYAGATGTNRYDPALNGGASFTRAMSTPTPSWWDDLANWKKYDIVMLSCEGGRHMEVKSAAALNNLETYIGLGGRVFASHFHNGWMANAAMASPLRTVATFPVDDNLGTINALINTNFTKGSALADWLQLPGVWGAGTPPARGVLPVEGARGTVGTINAAFTQSWVTYQQGTTRREQYFSFNTPVGAPVAEQCGQMVFTDLHVSSGANRDRSDATLPFPAGCTATSLSPQEKALIFMLFDLTNCLQPSVG